MSDIYGDQTVLLLHCEGANATTEFKDSAYRNHITANGNVQISTAQKMFGASSALFDGTGDYLTAPSSSNLDFGTGDFTIELMVYIAPTTVFSNSPTLFGKRPGTGAAQRAWVEAYFTAAGELTLAVASTSSTWGLTVTTSGGISTGVWHHVSAVRAGTTFTLYVDGVNRASGTLAGAIYFEASPLHIGCESAGQYAFQGYLDEIRITKGVARYTANFTPATVAFDDPTIFVADTSPVYANETKLLLHCDGVDASTDVSDSTYKSRPSVFGNARLSTAFKTSGTASLYLDGAGDYVDFPLAKTNTEFNVTGDFTLELSIKPEGIGTVQRPVISTYASNWSQVWCYFDILTTGILEVAFGVNRAILLQSDVALQTGKTYHIAVSRSGTTTKLFINGVPQSQTSSSTISMLIGNMVSGGFRLGFDSRISTYYQGYFDEVRFTNGVARYTDRFVPPTVAFPDPVIVKADDSPAYWTETKLLMHMDGTSASTYFNDERHNSVAPIGNAQLSVGQKKFGTTAALFDGNGDYLDLNNFGTSGAFGTGDFTIEADIYLQSGGAIQTIMDKANAYVAGNMDFRIEISASNRLSFLGGPDLTWFGNLAETEVPIGRWVHIAVCRVGANLLFFIGGVRVLSQAASFNVQNFKSQLRIGSINNSGATGSFFNGYLDNVRITKGVARYTDRFVPPTKAFSAPVTVDQYWNNVVLSVPGIGTPGSSAGIVDLKGHTFLFNGDTKISTTQGKFNGSSIYLDGAGDYFTANAHTDFSFGTGDFTIEMFAYFNVDSYGCIFRLGTNLIVLEKTGPVSAFSYSMAGSGNIVANSTPVGAWHHIAAVRISGVFYLYINGVQKSSMAFATNIAANQSMRFGADNVGTGSVLNGYLQGIRVTKGVGRYTGAFTPPTEPFPTAVPQALSGVVHDSSGNPIQRTARSYRRDTGQLVGTAVSDPTTGVFSLPADNTNEHFVVVFDDTKNALVYDHVVPVI